MKNSFPPLQHAAALDGCFPRIDRQFTIENFQAEKKKKQYLKHRSIPSENHTFCVESIVLPINQSKNWLIHSPWGHFLATIPLTRSQDNPGFEIELSHERSLRLTDNRAVVFKRIRPQQQSNFDKKQNFSTNFAGISHNLKLLKPFLESLPSRS